MEAILTMWSLRRYLKMIKQHCTWYYSPLTGYRFTRKLT